MNILIHSNNIYFNIGLAQCFRDIQETLPGLNIIHSLPLSHLPDLAGMDVIILALENYHDYQAAAELAQQMCIRDRVMYANVVNCFDYSS